MVGFQYLHCGTCSRIMNACRPPIGAKNLDTMAHSMLAITELRINHMDPIGVYHGEGFVRSLWVHTFEVERMSKLYGEAQVGHCYLFVITPIPPLETSQSVFNIHIDCLTLARCNGIRACRDRKHARHSNKPSKHSMHVYSGAPLSPQVGQASSPPASPRPSSRSRSIRYSSL